MLSIITKPARTLALASAVLLAAGIMGTAPVRAHKGHNHSHGAKVEIHKGYFKDDQVKPRTLEDWEGEWQSVYPLLKNGTLDPVMAQKAKQGDKSESDYRAYYDAGYKTDVDRIVIKGSSVTFSRGQQSTKADYVPDGYEVLTYAKGNRGVRFIFKKASGDEAAPQFIQFSDHDIAPEVAEHFHLYWGNDRAALLKEVTNWPTYYPAELTGPQVVKEMLAH